VTATDRDIARAVVNRIAGSRGLPTPWPAADAEMPSWLADADVSSWGVEELGAMRERLASKEERDRSGLWYTPPAAADFMTSFSINPILDRLADIEDPGNALQVLALDPACGAGVFLVSAARLIAHRYASLIARSEPTEWMVRHVMPEVMSECIFGIDRDPVAVDLAKASLWLEIDGTEPIGFSDRNIICGNALADDSPPKLEERRSSGQIESPQIAEQCDLFAEDVA
jgi:hypothetical protein